jgi:nitrogen-specific signal transduction histidine kinase
MSASNPPQPRARRTRKAAHHSAMQGLGMLLDQGLDRSALERMLLASISHRAGAGFARAHLLVWNADRGSLEGRMAWVGVPRRSLTDVLAAARHRASEGADAEATREVRALCLSPGELDGPLALAWARQQAALDDGCALHLLGHAGAVGAIPLWSDGRPYGLVVGEWLEAGDDSERLLALEAWRGFANAALAIHAGNELAHRRAEGAQALATLARTAVSSLNLAELGNALVSLAAHATGARGAVLWRVGENGSPELSCSFGPAGARDRLGRGLAPVAARCAALGAPVTHERVREAQELHPDIAAQLTTVAAVPLSAYGRLLGVLLVYDRLVHHPNDRLAFDAEDLALLTALGDQCAIAFQQAREGDSKRRLTQDKADLLRQVSRSERQAALGETAIRAARDARNPLATIGAFARRVHRSLSEEDPNREYLEVVIREADRLERTLAQPSEAPTAEGPRLKVESLNNLLQSALQEVGEQLVRRRVRLLKKLSPDLPPLLLDAERLGRVVRNVLGHALERVGPGGRIRVESRRVQQFVVVEVANDGLAHPGEVMSELFVPFVLRGDEGADLGLAMARQVVWQHGGEVRVRSEGEWSTVFTLTLPIRSNEDRRKPGNDRRVMRGDRRTRVPTG